MSTPMPDAGELEPSTLPLAQLRALRSQLQHEDDAISYVRRLAQARLDLVRAEICLLYTSDAADDLPCVHLGGRCINQHQHTII